MATREDVAKVLTYLSVLYPHGQIAKMANDGDRVGELANVVNAYHDILHRFPAEALQAAARRVAKGQKFFPAASELYQAAEVEMEHGVGVLDAFLRSINGHEPPTLAARVEALE